MNRLDAQSPAFCLCIILLLAGPFVSVFRRLPASTARLALQMALQMIYALCGGIYL